MKRASGISLIEVLVVITVIAILMGIGFLTLQRYTWRVELQTAQQNVVQAINQARSDTRKYSADTQAKWTSSDVSYGRGSSFKTLSLSDSGQVKITSIAGSITYLAPLGRRADNSTSITINLQGRGGLTGTVRVIGITGKAFAE
jgi:prepilin-type N-terminal cleavage/methylation domain-containing protein